MHRRNKKRTNAKSICHQGGLSGMRSSMRSRNKKKTNVVSLRNHFINRFRFNVNSEIKVSKNGNHTLHQRHTKI